MKLLGYIDDGITWFVNWQTNVGWWNLLIIPLEILSILIFWGMIRTRTPMCS